jgi:dTDP-4-amino-4,6-dideoxygalactose transaminase
MPTIPLTRPYINEAMKKAVAEVLDSRFLTEGPVTRRFERAVREYVGADYAVAVNNCTAGLELALRAVGLGEGDEAIVPDFTYPATADAVILAGGTAVVADVDPMTMLLTPDLAESVRTPRTRAAMPVSAFGNPLDYDGWARWSKDTGVVVVEDAAPALGASYKGRMVGSFSDLTVFSFHPRKSLTSGEGGMVLTNDRSRFALMQSYKHFGMTVLGDGSFAPPFASIGCNFKLSDILSALGLAQLEVLDEMVDRRRALAGRYIEKLSKLPGAEFPAETPGGRRSWQTFCLFAEGRDRLIAGLRERGVEANIGTHNLHREPAFQNSPRARLLEKYPGASFAGDRALSLPMYHEMTGGEQDHVIAALAELWR